MKKRILSILLCLCMVLSFFPKIVFSASADGTDSIFVGGVTLNNSTPYLANGASAAGADQPTSGGYVFFDAANGTLTLHNAIIEDDAWPFRTSYGIHFLGDLSIILEGTNTIKGDGVAGGYDSYGIYCSGDVIISGESATIEGGVVAGTVPISCGIYSEGDIKIISGSVTVKASSYAMNKAPIMPDTGYTVKTATYSTDTPAGDYQPDKIAEYGTVRVSPTSVAVGGVTLTDSTPYLANGASIAVADRPISGGYAHFDARTCILTLHNAIINGAASDTDNYGIYALDDLTIALEGSNSITSNDATFDDFFTTRRGDSKGIFVDGSELTVSGIGSLTVNSGKGAGSYGIYAEGVMIKDGATVQVFAGCADASSTGGAYSCGIYSGWGACLFSDGANITAMGGETESTSAKSMGICAWMRMTINGAEVTATGNTQAMDPAPTVTGNSITAATDVSGNDIVAYTAANIAEYKYLRVSPGVAQSQWGISGENGSAPTSWIQGDFSEAVNYVNSLTDETAYIQLLSDVNDAFMYISDGKSVILDLNGKTLDRGLSGEAAIDEGCVIAVNGGTLTLKDTGSGGKITGGNSTYGAGGGVTVRWGGVFNMEGGIITGNRAAYGGGVFVAQNSIDGRDSLFRMTGGIITGNDSTVYGGGVRIAEYSAMTASGTATIQDNFKGGRLSNGVYVQGSGEKSNTVLNGKAITLSGPLTGSIGIVKENDYLGGNGYIRIAVSDTSYEITQSDAARFISDSDDCIIAYSDSDSNPVVLLKLTYTVSYDANGATSGSLPSDTHIYGSGDTVTVASNSGNLQKTCHTFVGWNTKADGTGINYTAESGTFSISNNITLYAQWTEAHRGGTATCTEKAVCSVCGVQYGEVNASNHKHTEVRDAKEATCRETGYTGDTWCLDCGKKITEGHTVEMLEHKLVLVKAEDATAAKEGNIKYYYCENCGKYYSDEAGKTEIAKEDTVITKLPPKIIDGNNAKIDKSSKEDVSFCSDAAFADFIRVEVDGKELVKDRDYTLKENSIIVTLTPDFATTLTEGEHTLEIVSASGTALANFTVTDGSVSGTVSDTVSDNPAVNDSEESPKTGENSNIIFWIFMSVISIAALCTTGLNLKKNKEKVK